LLTASEPSLWSDFVRGHDNFPRIQVDVVRQPTDLPATCLGAERPVGKARRRDFDPGDIMLEEFHS